MKYPYFQKKIRKDIIARYLARSSIIPPDTIFENTYKLKPGEYVIYKDGDITDYTRYKPIYNNIKTLLLVIKFVILILPSIPR